MSSPPASSITPVVGGTSVLSGAGYSNFASIREAQLAQFQQTEFDPINNVVKEESPQGPMAKSIKDGSMRQFEAQNMRQCEKKECPTYFSPVCGTDGVTYDNQCKLNQMLCKTNRQVGFEHPGYCQPDKQIVNYKGQGYNLVASSYIDRNNKRAIYVIDDKLRSTVKYI
jgi:hypothetical protein